MLLGTYFLYVLGAILPVFIFLFLFCVISRPVEFNAKFLGRAFLISTFSTQIVLLMHMIFPGFNNESMFDSQVINLFFMAFIQVAFTEEIAKFLTFKATIPSKTHQIQPVTIMLISLISAGAFAAMENLLYLQSALQTLNDSQYSFFVINQDSINRGIWKMLGGRAAFAVMTHLFCGGTIGYFTAIGMTQPPKGKSSFSKFVNKTRKRRILLFSLYGIFIATIIHGAYDFNIFLAKEGLSSVSKMKQYMYFVSGTGLLMIRQMIITLRGMKNHSKDEIPQ